MKKTQTPPNKHLASRKSVLISGVLSTFLGYEFLDAARLVIALPDWQPVIAQPRLHHWLFWLLLFHGVFWTSFSLYQVRLLASPEHMQDRLVPLPMRRHPLFFYMPVFLLHSALALLFVLLTGNSQLGAILASLTMWHALISLIFVPIIVRNSG